MVPVRPRHHRPARDEGEVALALPVHGRRRAARARGRYTDSMRDGDSGAESQWTDEFDGCEALGCTNPGGAFTSERDGRIYQFCSHCARRS